jgi:hypothetical protein
LRVRVYPSDNTGCGWYRLRFAALALAAQGADITISDHIPALWDHTPDGDRIVGAATYDADVAVFQRVFRPDILTVIRSLREQGVAVVVDVDDDFSALHPRHPVWAQLHPKNSSRNWSVLAEACREADLVTVSTPALAAKYGGTVVRNCVPRAYLGITAEREDLPIIGWTGTPKMHPDDLEMVGDAVARVCEGEATFRAIGDRATLDVLGVEDQEHVPGARLDNLDYAHLVAQLDIGIVPLADSAFNQSKSWLKGLEYAALGVPFVASIVAEYEALIQQGAGSLASRPRQWYACLRNLAESADMRLEMADRGRTVAARHTIEDTMAPQVWEAWKAARYAKTPVLLR